MNITKTLITLAMILAVLALAPAATAQTAMSTTTLSAAVSSGNCNVVTLTVGSTTGMLASGSQNNINTLLYVDTELMQVISVPTSTTVNVQRCKGGIGLSMRPRPHVSGATVYFASTSGAYPNSVPGFPNDQSTAETYGGCTATTEPVLPKVYIFSGDVFNCGSSGEWFKQSIGTMNAAGARISGFCTGTVGSAEADFLNGAACSGATTSTARQVVSTPGVLANLYVFSSAAFVGTGGSIAKVYKNGTATAIVCSPVAAATTCNDTTHSVSVVPGDVITFYFLAATSDTAANVSMSVGQY